MIFILSNSCGGEDMMEDSLKKLILSLRAEPVANTNGRDAKAVGLFAKICMVPGNPSQV
jgi:hypothetical protein